METFNKIVETIGTFIGITYIYGLWGLIWFFIARMLGASILQAAIVGVVAAVVGFLALIGRGS